MKSRLIIISLMAVVLSACGSRELGPYSKHKHDSIGAAFEIFVVTPKNVWESPIGDTLRYVLMQDVPMLNQSEPQFTLKNLQPQFFKKLNSRHRNIIRMNIADTLSAGVEQKHDLYSKGQEVVIFNAPDTASMIYLILNNRDELISLFEDAEFNRYNATAKSVRNNLVCDSIYKMFGFKMDIPKGFNIRNVEKPDFMWISYETASVSQGIVIHTYSVAQSDLNSADILVMKRNDFVSRIPGSLKGSYMKTSAHVFPDMTKLNIKGHNWLELRGLWSVENDFMGGPFVNYSTINPVTGVVLSIDFYVYSPKPNKPKRNLLKQLESMMYSVTFPKAN